MALTTVRNSLNDCNPQNGWDQLRRLYDTTNDLGFADIIAALRPRDPRERTGLTSSATQVHDVAAWILSVYTTGGTALTIVHGAAAGAGEVRVQYNSTTGVPTLVFGDGAVTAYSVLEMGPFPQGMSTAFTASTGG